MSKSTSIEPGASTLAYQLYVELDWVRPKVWRRFLVPVTIELQRLHVVLLLATGWDGGHIHEFVFGHDNYAALEPGSDLPDGVEDEEGVTLGDALGARKTFLYIYDYGDNWRHKVKVEKVVSLDAEIDLAVCIGGENACPPEDVGGAPGYEDFLEALADPAHPEHAEQKAWIGRAFDPREFTIEEVNRRLTPEPY
ncbi:plasmid pRiA4b ORF-3 family protein [Variovorax sp. dw_308]|uniref:plasmid pRiA4b ORF-3 family protein n=1 Tax=Variovorax sp. dw_308 TaxID=2721546 RepID=UPI001C43B0B1|nr:plasmid pRiA4b ORF-3 family protein [Variovorax sp. dw_308]